MENLWGQSSRVRLLMGNVYKYVSVLEWGTWSWYLCTKAVASSVEQTYSGVYANRTVHDFVHHADLV